jgi:hypothetical protein
METVEGIILILSCEKHMNTRLKKYGPQQQTYDGWKVIKVIGNLFLTEDYVLEGSLLYIKCEDSYLHLLKKLSLAIKHLSNFFEIKQGILRCGDDLIFNEERLVEFIHSQKYDYFGQSPFKRNHISNDISLLKNVKYDPFMLQYYVNHQNELTDKKHGIHMSLEELNKYLIRPYTLYAAGVIYYISKSACEIIVNHMEKIDYNILQLDKYTNSYPYLIEDTGISLILYSNNINFINYEHFYDTPISIAKHTNYLK